MNINKVFLAGNLTRDPETRSVGGTEVCSFGLAVNKKYTAKSGEKREEVLFIDCNAWGKTGETIARYCSKGSGLFIEGELKLDQWEGKDGSKQSRIKVTVLSFQFVGDRAEKSDRTSKTTGLAYHGRDEMTEDDIPF